MDVYDLWERHDYEQERAREEYPLCSECSEHIQDDYYYEIDEELFCEECMNEKFRRRTDEYKA